MIIRLKFLKFWAFKSNFIVYSLRFQNLSHKEWYSIMVRFICVTYTVGTYQHMSNHLLLNAYLQLLLKNLIILSSLF
jgi:hypothetical protein